MATGTISRFQNEVVSIESLTLGGTAVTATAAELNASVAGNTSTAAEINRATDISARIVGTTATVLALTVTQHAERIVLVNVSTTAGIAITLPVATGSGAKFTVINNVAKTQGSVVVAANGTLDTMVGVAFVANTSTTVNVQAFQTSSTSDKVTFDRTTSGGGGVGDIVEAYDSTANVWVVQVRSGSVGNAATPFSQT
jgi:hypothetical protein